VIWRLCAEKYAGNAFSGEGAELYGGRWSPPGLRVAYCAESRALAVVEILANAEEPDRLSHLKWSLIAATLPESAIEKPARFPANWRQFPHPPDTQAVGAAWLRAGQHLALRVPSAVVPGEFNYLVNPAHPAFAKVVIAAPERFAFDPRLI
jgi:RES domain-containing protein